MALWAAKRDNLNVQSLEEDYSIGKSTSNKHLSHKENNN